MRQLLRHTTLTQLAAPLALIFLALIFLTANTLATPPSRAEGHSTDLTGHWLFNEELSDDPQEKLSQKIRSRGADGRFGGRFQARAQERIQAAKQRIAEAEKSFDGFETLHIEPRENGLSLTNAEEITFEIFTDGRSDQDLGERESVGVWKDGRLVVERQGDRGKRNQSYSLEEGRLLVETTLAGDRGSLEIRRLYDRAE